MGPVRAVAVAAAIACSVAACAGGPSGTDVLPGAGTEAPAGEPTSAPDGAGDPAASDGPGAAEPGGAGDPASDPPQGDARTEGEGGAAAVTPVDDLGPVGANGRAMLRGDRASLVVEVDVQDGVSPSQDALDHLAATLARHADKPGGISFAGGNRFTSDRTSWSSADLREVAAANRTTASDDDTVSLYVLYVRGGFTSDGEETNAIGVAYRASEVALFPERWSGIGDLLGGSRQLERAVLVHELGHVLGLVNLTYESDIDHEDPDNPGHSSNRGSVMYWAIETTLIGQVFNGPPPDTFDEADAADLAALREGG